MTRRDSWPELNPDLEKAKVACQKSLQFLCTQFLGYQDWDFVHDEVELILRRPSQKKAILLPRDHLKSTIVTISYSIQSILREKNIRILIANQVWDMARRFLSEIKGQLENSQLKYLFGNFVSGKWNADDIVVSQRTKALKEPTILTTGVEAETTGGHFDLIIADDLMGEQNYRTAEQREKVKRFRRSLVNLLEPNGVMIDVMTRWHLDDTYQEILEKEKEYYDVLKKSVVEDGRLIFPKKFSKKFDSVKKNFVIVPDDNCMDYVDFLKKTKPLDEFMALYMNQPIASENQVFRKEMFQYWSKRPDNLFVCMTVDPAISLKQSADWTAIVVSGMDESYNIYVLDVMRGHWSPREIIDNIFTTHAKWRPSVVGLETIGFQKTLKYAIEDEMRKRRNYFPIEEIKQATNVTKEFRIKALEPFYRGGNIFHASWMTGLEHELLTFPQCKNDDMIDALSMSLNFLVPGMRSKTEDVPVGSWEWEAREARGYMSGKRDFFRHG